MVVIIMLMSSRITDLRPQKGRVKNSKRGGVKKYDFQDFQIFTCPPVIMGGGGVGQTIQLFKSFIQEI